ncbi:MAG: chemotaxis protein CheW [Ktedonobacteraceae bacterium]|nr:chemotaxis protein CheW [Ktedonobacteraceae bacterium]
MDKPFISQDTSGSRTSRTRRTSRAYAGFLEQLSDEDFWQYAESQARHFSMPERQAEEYLVCDIGKGYCALPLADLYEVRQPPQRFTQLPAMPAWMTGVTIWRDTIIAVVDLRAYLTNSSTNRRVSPAPGESMLLITYHKEIVLGLLTPIVEVIEHPAARQMEPAEQAKTCYTSPCTGAIREVCFTGETMAGTGQNDEQELLLLDIPVILSDITQRIRIAAAHG